MPASLLFRTISALFRTAGEISQLRWSPAGEILFQEGDRETELYILLEGQVQSPPNTQSQGDLFFQPRNLLDIIGWSSLTHCAPTPSAWLVASKISILLALRREAARLM
jgi:CRP-like cAMP-binding protein